MEFGDGAVADLGHVNGVGTTSHTFNAGGYNVTSVFTEAGTDVRHTIRLEVRGGGSPGPGPGVPGPSCNRARPMQRAAPSIIACIRSGSVGG